MCGYIFFFLKTNSFKRHYTMKKLRKKVTEFEPPPQFEPHRQEDKVATQKCVQEHFRPEMRRRRSNQFDPKESTRVWPRCIRFVWSCCLVTENWVEHTQPADKIRFRVLVSKLDAGKVAAFRRSFDKNVQTRSLSAAGPVWCSQAEL